MLTKLPKVPKTEGRIERQAGPILVALTKATTATALLGPEGIAGTTNGNAATVALPVEATQ